MFAVFFKSGKVNIYQDGITMNVFLVTQIPVLFLTTLYLVYGGKSSNVTAWFNSFQSV